MIRSLIAWSLTLLASPVLGERLAAQRTGETKQEGAVRVTVVSAKRAEKWFETSTELKPSRAQDVVLVVDIAGLSIEEFQRAHRSAGDKIFLSAAGARYQPSSFVSGAWGEPGGKTKEDRLILVVVPRATLAFELHLLDSPVVHFTVDTLIAAKLP